MRGDARKKLEGMRRKLDELSRKSKITSPAAGEVRQAAAQFAAAAERTG